MEDGSANCLEGGVDGGFIRLFGFAGDGEVAR